MKHLIIFILVGLTGLASAQVLTPEMKKRIYRDTFLDYDPELDVDSVRSHQQRDVVSYPPIREADVLWSKRVWREIEVSQKINLPLYYPLEDIADRECLFDIIQTAYQNELVQPFDWESGGIPGDDFRFPISAEFCDSMRFGTIKEIPKFDPGTGEEIGLTQKPYKYQNNQVVSYRIKEDWYFDKQRSQMMVKILGIMPKVEVQDGNTGEMNVRNTAWFYFPELRNVLVNYEVFNWKNKTQRMTFDDIFVKRYFSSHIVKQENVYNRRIADVFPNTYDQLLESEKIKNEVITFEHDLWSY